MKFRARRHQTAMEWSAESAALVLVPFRLAMALGRAMPPVLAGQSGPETGGGGCWPLHKY